jgi:hypothetical protein
MDTDALKNLTYLIAGMFGFICTIWAICIPAIRDHPGGHVGFLRITSITLGGLILLVLFSMTGIIPIDGVASKSEEYAFWEYVAGWILTVILIAVGPGLILTLAELSKRPK